MSQQELLTRAVRILNATSTPYMVVGSIASSLQGEARLTHDIDLVVQISPTAVKMLIDAFPSPDYYIDEVAAQTAIAQSGMFNLLDVTNGDKIDFWLLTDEPYDLARFERRYVENVFGVELQVTAPEDTILSKLRWAKMAGGSEKQMTDAIRVLEVQRENLDLDYLRSWAAKLEVDDLLKDVEARTEFDAL